MPIEQKIWSLDTMQELVPDRLISEKELEDFPAKNISLLNDQWMVIGRQVRTVSGGIIDLERLGAKKTIYFSAVEATAASMGWTGIKRRPARRTMVSTVRTDPMEETFLVS